MNKELRIKKIKKDDNVKILLGKDNGKSGKVLKIDPKKGRVWVDGLNLYKRHVKGRSGVEGGIIDIPKSLNISNVGLVCPKCKKITRVGFKLNGDVKVRFCKKCQEVI